VYAALDYDVGPAARWRVVGGVVVDCLLSSRVDERRRGCRVDWSFVITDVLGTIPRGNSNDIYELLEI
jgi:hypothetical protein